MEKNQVWSCESCFKVSWCFQSNFNPGFVPGSKSNESGGRPTTETWTEPIPSREGTRSFVQSSSQVVGARGWNRKSHQHSWNCHEGCRGTLTATKWKLWEPWHRWRSAQLLKEKFSCQGSGCFQGFIECLTCKSHCSNKEIFQLFDCAWSQHWENIENNQTSHQACESILAPLSTLGLIWAKKKPENRELCQTSVCALFLPTKWMLLSGCCLCLVRTFLSTNASCQIEFGSFSNPNFWFKNNRKCALGLCA